VSEKLNFLVSDNKDPYQQKVRKQKYIIMKKPLKIHLKQDKI